MATEIIGRTIAGCKVTELIGQGASTMVAWVLGCVFLLQPCVLALAQTSDDCTAELKVAEQLFYNGDFDKSVALLKECLGKTDFPDSRKKDAYVLLAQNYLAKSYLDDARDAIRKLLELVPDYIPPSDSPELVAEVEKVKKELMETQETVETPPASQDERGFSTDALWRSALVPGWGQLHDGANLKGWGFLIGALSGATFVFFAQQDFSEKLDVYNADFQAHQNATSQVEEIQLRESLNLQHSELKSAGRLRRVAIWGTAALYALNVVDAVIFHSSGGELSHAAENDAPVVLPFLSYSSGNLVAGLRLRF